MAVSPAFLPPDHQALAVAVILAARPLRTFLERQLGGIETRLDRRLGELDARRPASRSLGRRLLSASAAPGRSATRVIVERLRQARRNGNRADAPAGNDLSTSSSWCYAGPESTWRLRRALARHCSRLPRPRATALQHTFRTGERAMRRTRGQARSRRCEGPARQLPAPGRGGRRRRARAAREGLRARREGARMRSRASTSSPCRGHLRLRVHVPALGGHLLRARLRQDRQALRVRARSGSSRFRRRRSTHTCR